MWSKVERTKNAVGKQKKLIRNMGGKKEWKKDFFFFLISRVHQQHCLPFPTVFILLYLYKHTYKHVNENFFHNQQGKRKLPKIQSRTRSKKDYAAIIMFCLKYVQTLG